jgi:hypothetical protein
MPMMVAPWSAARAPARLTLLLGCRYGKKSEGLFMKNVFSEGLK